MNRVTLALILSALVFSPAFGDEEGFEKLFNGKDFSGWKFHFKNEGHDPARTFSVQDGIVVCKGRPAGYMYTEGEYQDCVLRFDFRFKRPDGLEDDSQFRGNSGYLFFVKDHNVWPRSLETQGRNMDCGKIFTIGAKDRSKNKWKWDKAARDKAIKKLGEWNRYEVIVKDGTVRVNINGVLVTTVDQHEYEGPGHIGFQSEGAEIHWRNIRIKKS